MNAAVVRYPEATPPSRPRVGEVGFRVTNIGAQPVFVNRFLADGMASVCNKGRLSAWAQAATIVAADDLFAILADARKEFRLRSADVRAGLRAHIIEDVRTRRP